MSKSVSARVLATMLLATVIAACQPSSAAVPPSSPGRSAPPTPEVPVAATIVANGPLFVSDVGRSLSPGRHTVDTTFGAPFSFVVPAGFGLDVLRLGNVAVSAPSGYLGVFIADGVFSDPCRATADPVRTVGANQLVAALRGMKGFTAGPMTEATLDGRRVRTFELSNAIDTTTAGCTRGSMLPLFTSVGSSEGEATNGGTRQRLWVLDGALPEHLGPGDEGSLLIVADSWGTEADLRLLEGIVASIDFE